MSAISDSTAVAIRQNESAKDALALLLDHMNMLSCDTHMAHNLH